MSVNLVKQQLEEFQREVLAGHIDKAHQPELLESIAADLSQLCDDDMVEHEELSLLSSQLDQQAVHFEQYHPNVASVMRQIIDSLAKMGV